MDKETIIRLAKEAGMQIHEGAQDRVLYEGSIVAALARFADLVTRHVTRPSLKSETHPVTPGHQMS